MQLPDHVPRFVTSVTDKSAQGLGRVITRRRGCRRTATGGMHIKVTVSSVFFPISVWEANLLHHRAVLTCSRALQRLQPDRVRPRLPPSAA
jgi:hypothetical protein